SLFFSLPYFIVQLFFPTRRSSDLKEEYTIEFDDRCDVVFVGERWMPIIAERMARFYVSYMYPNESDFPDHHKKFMAWPLADVNEDRKSTRLNSSHVKSSYAVFCLK